MIEKILDTDFLYQGVNKLNAAIDLFENADANATEAVNVANAAKDSAEQTRTELDAAILAGDSSPLAGQLSVGADAITYPSAQERLLQEHEQVTSQLAEKAQQEDVNKLKSPNAKQRLNLTSAYGDTDAFHPKVISFEPAWNGYKYWISFTPYPQAQQALENPHVLASNDMVTWVEHAGFNNPLEPQPSGDPSLQYNSDAHIVYNFDVDRIEVFWRYVDDSSGTVTVYRKTTTDGFTWSAKQQVLTATRSLQDYISLAVIYENNLYKMWYVNNGYVVEYIESSDGLSWSEPRVIDITYSESVSSWHLDVIHTDVGYEMFITAFEDVSDRNNMTLFYSVSSDNVNYSTAVPLLTPSDHPSTWDNRGIYRAGVFKENGIYYMFYSAVSRDWKRGTGLTFAKDLNYLNGLDQIGIPSQVMSRRTLTIGMVESGVDYRIYPNNKFRDTLYEFVNNTFIPKSSGMYLITSYFTFSNLVENTFYFRLYEDGFPYKTIGGIANQQVASMSRMVYLTAGRSYDFYVAQNSGTSKTVTDFNFEVVKL